MNIKFAGIEDLKHVVPLFDLYRQFYEQKSDLPGAEKFLKDRILNDESVIILALDEQKNLGMGFVQLYPVFSSVSMRRVWILNDLYVDSFYRRQGVAEALIKKTKEFAHGDHAKGIQLETQSSNVQARRLYDKTGFVKDDDHFYYFHSLQFK